MKKLLATSALALVGFASAASAQSVLERVLGEIDNSTNLASVNGTFANIAENIGGATTVNVYTDTNGNIYSQAEWDAAQIDIDTGDYTLIGAGNMVNPTTGAVLTDAQYIAAGSPSGYLDSDTNALYKGVDGSEVDNQVITSAAFSNLPAADFYTKPTLAKMDVIAGPAVGIDGSILNIVDGITDATQTATAGVVNAVEYNMPTLDWGNMSTTVLGAVNTGEITLGVNQSVEQAKTTSTGALSSLVDQIGGSADTGALVLNVASNMTGVNGSIRNTMTEVNGTVGNLGTTVLGAVNTGTITSGVNAAVTGIVGGGTSQTGGIPTN